MKIALVGLIKDEASDILAWLGWHALLGVDTFILFDDGSSDGTRALIKAASLQWDIRLFCISHHHLDPQAKGHESLQKQVYLDVLNHVGDAFDWVGFIDSDEYIALFHHQNLHDFLGNMGADIGAVALHWRIHGSNGHMHKPNMPAFHAFTRHATSALNDSTPNINCHVKSFIRPSCWNGDWANFHFFPLKEGRYIDPMGNDIQWSHTKGITQTAPNWEVACVMHYQNRSMAHYLERIRRRNDVTLSLDSFLQNDRNEEEDLRPLAHTTAVLEWMRSAVRAGAAQALGEVAAQHPAQTPLPFVSSLQTPETFSVFALSPENGDNTTLQGQHIYKHADQNSSPCLYLLQKKSHPTMGFLFALNEHEELVEFTILNDSRLYGPLRYDATPLEDGPYITLRPSHGHSLQKDYLSAPPNEPWITNRKQASQWEFFIPVPCERTPAGHSWLTIPYLHLAEMALQEPVTLSTLSQLSTLDRNAAIWLLPLLYDELTPTHQQELSHHLHALTPFIL